MSHELEKLEKTLGGKIERRDQRAIPGAIPVPGQEVIYFSDDGINIPAVQFHKLTRQVAPPLLKDGGASERGCTIQLPDGTLFRALSYHGDVEGWRRQIRQGAKELNVLTAVIDKDKIKISDGREVMLSECKVEFS